MNELRQEFESLCLSNLWNIAKDGDGIYFDDFVNGAWWAYQEQHKKFFAYLKMFEMQKAFDEANEIFSSVERIASGMRFGGYFEPMKYEVAGVVAEKELHYGEYLIDTSTVDKPQQSITIALDDDKIKEIFMVNSNELHNNR